MKTVKYLFLFLLLLSLPISFFIGCDKSPSDDSGGDDNTNTLVGGWILTHFFSPSDTVTVDEFEIQTGMSDFMMTLDLRSTGMYYQFTQYPDKGITYTERDTGIWSVNDNLLITQSPDSTDKDTLLYAINANQLTLLFEDTTKGSAKSEATMSDNHLDPYGIILSRWTDHSELPGRTKDPYEILPPSGSSIWENDEIDLATAILGIWNTTKILMMGFDIQALMGVTMQADFLSDLNMSLDVTTPDTTLTIPGTYETYGATGLDVYLYSTHGTDTLSGTFITTGNEAVFNAIMPVEMIQSMMEGNPLAGSITTDQQITFELLKE